MFPILYAVLFNTSNALAVWISLVFWLVLYDPVRVGERIWQNHYEHTLNSVVVMADFFIERRKVFMADYWMVGLNFQSGVPRNPGVQFNRHLKVKAWVKAWVKDEVKDAFRKALDRDIVKAWVKAVQNVY